MSRVQQVAVTVGTQASSSGLNFLTGILLARLLGPAGFGIMSLCTLYVAVVVLAGSLSNSSIIHVTNRENCAQTAVAFNGLALAFFTSVLGFAASGFIFIRLYGELIEGVVSPGYFLFFSTAVVVSAVANSMGYSTLAGGSTKWFNLMAVSQPASWFIFVAIAAATGEFGVDTALTGYLVSHCSRLLVGVLSFREFWQWQEARFNGRLFAKLARESSSLYTAGILSFANYRIDFFLVAYLAGPAQMGLYAIATRVAEQVSLLSVSVAVVLLGSVARTERKVFLSMVRKAARYSLAGTGLAAVVVVLAAPFFVPLTFGAPYAESVLPLMLLLPGVLALSVGRCAGSAHIGLGHFSVAAISGGTALLLLVGLDLLLIPWAGILGAAAASAIGYTVASAIQVLFFRSLYGARPGDLFLLNRGDVQMGWGVLLRSLRRLRLMVQF